MRPIDITLSAFSSYAGEEYIDMSQLGKTGLYLISGETGAGKTTIFDGIVYALFGETCSDKRDVSMLRSTFAKKDTLTFVELNFEHDGKEYFIRRVPKQDRLNKKGEYINKPTEVELKLPDGSSLTKVTEVDDKIKEIIGVDADQFKQIVMIAQGDFKKLLQADTKQRTEIFRELFKTGKYAAATMQILQETSQAGEDCDRLRNSVDQYIEQIKCDSDSTFQLEIDKAKSKELSTSQTVDLLQALIEEDEKNNKDLSEQINKFNEDIESLDKQIGQAGKIQEARDRLAQNERQYHDKKLVNKDLQEKQKVAKSNLSKQEKILSEKAAIEATLPNYQQHQEISEKIISATKGIEQSDKNIKELLKSQENTQGQIKHAQDIKEKYKDVNAQLVDLAHKIEDTNKKYENLKLLKNDSEDYSALKEDLLSKQEEVKRLSLEADRLDAEYKLKNKAFIAGQAGLLARDLQEGDKCPVCGNTHHVELASLEDDFPSQEELDLLNQQTSDAQERFNKAGNEASSINSRFKELEKQILKSAKELMDVDSVEDIVEKLQKVMAEAQSIISDLKAKEEALKEQKVAVAKAESDLPRLEETLAKNQSTLAIEKESIAANEASLKNLTEQKDKLKQNMKYESLQAAKAAVNSLGKEAEALQEVFDKADLAFKKSSEDIKALEGAIETDKKNIANAEDINLDSLKNNREELVSSRDTLLEEIAELKSRMDTNKVCKVNIEKKEKEVSAAEEKYAWMSSLAKTASGTIKGKEKIPLETYVQATYFDKILTYANRRFTDMSGGNYELRRAKASEKSGTSKTGLELDVYEYDHGTCRSANSISGGESFMASLSLALGLSDEVQAEAGGIKIETLFVDEGFGSLSSTYLDNAYKALTTITEEDRLVGVISHVEDLKEKIDYRIEVEKTPNGGSSTKVVV